ncbi:HAD-IIIC family phosphatase [Streptomyces sp. NPDC026589]|uniref:HAD-IIIC family phosphatase n=1 Tax=Streptomyces sp. NPDC026589 TaxID=3155609 RepID=UPI0033E27D17
MTQSIADQSTEAVTAAKCVVWDLDDTLWHGTLADGDDVVLKDGVAEIVRTLDARGILQSIASKNNHDDAVRKLNDFGIAEYFLRPQINWNSKSSSIAAIREQLNIGIDTIMFVDDQAYERDEVAFVHPRVETVDAAEYRSLASAPRLTPAVVTDDARRRRLMYLEDEARAESEGGYQGPREDFLRSLDMVFSISRATEEDLARLEELTRRTNQLNSTGVHYSYDDLERLLDDSGHDLWVCELVDRYGSYGKIGMALVAKDDHRWTIKMLLMSCRTVSKGVGTVLLSALIQRASEQGVRLFADFRRTDRNRQMLLTYQLANFQVVSSDGANYLYENDLSVHQEYPDYIVVNIDAE